MKRLISVLIFSYLLTMTSCSSSKPVFHKSTYDTKQDAAFSDVVQVGKTLYLSGQLGLDHNNKELVSGGVVPETKKAIENIQEVLKAHNSDLNQVVKVQVILKDITDFQAFNEVYKIYFPNKPARTTFAASGLARDASVEIEVIAITQ